MQQENNIHLPLIYHLSESQKPTHSSTHTNEFILSDVAAGLLSGLIYHSCLQPLLIHPQVCLAGVFQTVGSADLQKVCFTCWCRLHHQGWGALSAQKPFQTPSHHLMNTAAARQTTSGDRKVSSTPSQRMQNCERCGPCPTKRLGITDQTQASPLGDHRFHLKIPRHGQLTNVSQGDPYNSEVQINDHQELFNTENWCPSQGSSRPSHTGEETKVGLLRSLHQSHLTLCLRGYREQEHLPRGVSGQLAKHCCLVTINYQSNECD